MGRPQATLQSWAVVIAITLAMGRAASAAPSSANESAGLAKFDQAKKAYEAKDWSVALQAFQSSLELLPSPNTRLYIARCFRALGKYASAHTQFELAAREAQDRVVATGEKRYAATVEAATAEGAEVLAKVGRLEVALSGVAPSDLEIRIDGAPLAKAAWGSPAKVDPGSHVVRATGHRVRPFEVTVEVAEAGKAKVTIVLERLPTSVLHLSLSLQPQGIALSLDGKAVDAKALSDGVELDPGPHHLVVRAPGYRPFEWKESLADGASKTVSVPLEPDSTVATGTPAWMFFGVAGLSVTSLGVATVFAVRAKSVADREKRLPGPQARDPGAQEDIQALSLRANVLYLSGAAFAVGAGVLFFTTRWSGASSKESAGLQWKPWVGPGDLGLGLTGAF